jgi:PAS domain S-box-containing protein
LVNTSGEVTKQKPDEKTSQAKTTKGKFIAENWKELRIAADILESTNDYVSSFDKNWNFIYINKTTAKYFGFEPEELIGKNFWKTFPHFVGTAVEKNYLEAMEKREIRRFEWKTIYANTGFREFTVFPSAEGIMVYGVDITERKQLEQKLEEHTKNLEMLVEERTKQLQEKERLATIGQTAGMVGHDIRNPLQSIVSSLYLIKENLDNLPDSKEKDDASAEIDSIYEQINYVDKIISDLQDYARPLTPELVEVELNTIVTASLSTLNVRCGKLPFRQKSTENKNRPDTFKTSFIEFSDKCYSSHAARRQARNNR